MLAFTANIMPAKSPNMPDTAPEQNPPEPPPSQSTGAAVAERPAPTRTPPRQLPPYRVLLHNDDVNSVDHVIVSLLKLTPLNLQQAAEVTMEADATGVALVLVTHQELAELYQEQLQSQTLTVTIEPAE